MKRKCVVLFVSRVNAARPTAPSIQFDSFTTQPPFIRTFRFVMALLQFFIAPLVHIFGSFKGLKEVEINLQ